MGHLQHNKLFRTLDIFGVFFFIIFGIGGFIIILNPIQGLLPHTPLLSPEDWAGSVSYRGVQEENTYSRKPVEQRQFEIRMRSVSKGAGITQEVIWYPDVIYAAEAFGKNREPFEMELVKTTQAQEGVPASELYCGKYKEIGFACGYFAYHGNWYTQIRFESLSNQWLSFSDVESLIGRVNELLMSAPPKP